MAICTQALRVLALMSNRNSQPACLPFDVAPPLDLLNAISPGNLLLRGKLLPMWRHMRSHSAEASAGQSVTLAMRAREPGEIATCEQLLNETSFRRVIDRAASALVSPAWLCAAAWVRAIGGWNALRGITGPGVVSLEVPVSFRPRSRRHDSVGNFVSPLLVFGDAAKTLNQLAFDLRKQFRKQLEQRSHLGIPIFTAPARYAPWAIFRRLAVNRGATGFATSHFTWLEHTDLEGLSEPSDGAIRFADAHLYTPVCLHMGAALAVLPIGRGAKFVVTHRRTAFSAEDAETLLELVSASLHSERAIANGTACDQL